MYKQSYGYDSLVKNNGKVIHYIQLNGKSYVQFFTVLNGIKYDYSIIRNQTAATGQPLEANSNCPSKGK